MCDLEPILNAVRCIIVNTIEIPIELAEAVKLSSVKIHIWMRKESPGYKVLIITAISGGWGVQSGEGSYVLLCFQKEMVTKHVGRV